MTFGNKLVKLFAVLLILQSARATVLTPSVLFDCLLGKNFDLRKHNEGKIFYFLDEKLKAGQQDKISYVSNTFEANKLF